MDRRIFLFTVAAVAAAAAGAFAAYSLRNIQLGYRPPIEFVEGRTLPDFTLTDQNGKPFTLSSVKGKAVLIYFGYTNCPDVCPTVLSKYTQAISVLGMDADKAVFLFITVDPERDDVATMKKYLSYYSPKIIGLTGRPEEVKKVLDAYGVVAVKNSPDEQGRYFVDHSAFVYGADKNHVLRLALTPELPVDDYVNSVRWLLSR